MTLCQCHRSSLHPFQKIIVILFSLVLLISGSSCSKLPSKMTQSDFESTNHHTNHPSGCTSTSGQKPNYLVYHHDNTPGVTKEATRNSLCACFNSPGILIPAEDVEILFLKWGHDPSWKTSYDQKKCRKHGMKHGMIWKVMNTPQNL